MFGNLGKVPRSIQEKGAMLENKGENSEGLPQNPSWPSYLVSTLVWVSVGVG
jgi:hypothetical protein